MKGYRYREIDGIKNFPDSFIMSLWDRIEAEGKRDQVHPVSETYNRKDFLISCRSGRFHLWVFFKENKLFALMWVSNLRLKRAECHFCTFDGFPRNIVNYSKLAQEMVINYYGLDVLYGMTPSNNTKALKFLNKLGWKEIGILPQGSYIASEGKSIDSVIMYYGGENEDL